MPVDGRGDVPQPEPDGDEEQCHCQEWQTSIGTEAPTQHTERRGHGDHSDRTDGEQVPEIAERLARVKRLVEGDQQRDEQAHGQTDDERGRPRSPDGRARRHPRLKRPLTQHDP